MRPCLQLDQSLLEHLRAAPNDFVTKSNLASLISRFATGTILPGVLEVLDANIGKWGCDTQSSLLAYVVRVDPQLCRPRIEKALSARGKNFTACNKRVLSEVSAIYYGPVLEPIAVRALQDGDVEINIDAALTLAGHGSPASESALWRRYESWCKRWAGREAELNRTGHLAAEEQERNPSDAELGRMLVEYIATGDAWLTDEAKLQRLSSLTKANTIQYEVDLKIERWNQRPLRINFSCVPNFSASAAHYHFNSMGKLQQKLKQFPSGTEFALSPDDPCDEKYVTEIRDFLTGNGMSITD